MTTTTQPLSHTICTEGSRKVSLRLHILALEEELDGPGFSSYHSLMPLQEERQGPRQPLAR